MGGPDEQVVVFDRHCSLAAVVNTVCFLAGLVIDGQR
jgi:hypothetical protein